jgi:hypothetical protein
VVLFYFCIYNGFNFLRAYILNFDQAVIKTMKQARDNMFLVVDALKKDKSLVQLDGKYKFQFPRSRFYEDEFKGLHRK